MVQGGRAKKSTQLPLLRLVRDQTGDGRGQRLRMVGLFAGIGGLELGLMRAGHSTVLLNEIDPAANAVLSVRFPESDRSFDVRTLKTLPREIDLLSAGFPCQDLSQAGKTAGIAGNRSGLVTEVFRLLERAKRSRRPVSWVLLENVPFMLSLNRGKALEVVINALEGLGYRWAYRIVDSHAFGLPQRRERVFLLASMEHDPRRVLFADEAGAPDEAKPSPDLAFGFYWTEGVRGLGAGVDCIPTLKGGSTIGIPSPPAIVLPAGQVVTPGIEDGERLQGFPSGWTEPGETVARRGHRWKLIGNAVTVDVARWIGARLLSPGDYDDSWDATLCSGAAWPVAAWNMGHGRRRAVNVSAWPFVRRARHLHDFLKAPLPLSMRATAGFLQRLRSGRLKRPVWFEPRLERHLEIMTREDLAREADRKAAAVVGSARH